MRRFGVVFGLAAAALLGSVERSEASKLTLGYTVSYSPSSPAFAAFGPGPISRRLDTFAFTPHEWFGRFWDAEGQGASTPLGGPFQFDAVLYDDDAPIAEETGQGMLNVSMNPTSQGLASSGASGYGIAYATDVKVLPGVDPSLVPSWFSELRLQVEVNPTVAAAAGHGDTTTNIIMDPAPEPGSVVVFLAMAGGGLAMVRRRSRRAGE